MNTLIANISRAIPFVLWTLLVHAGVAAQPSPVDFPDAASLASEMRRLSHGSGPLQLPPVWHVKTPDGEFSIPSNSTHEWLEQHATELDRYSHAVQPVDAKPMLQRILESPRFTPRVSHHWWDPYRDRFDAWIKQVLRRLFAFIGKSPISGGLVFWLALAGAAALLALWLVRPLRSNGTGLQLTGSSYRAPHGTWEEWTAAMRAARQSGDFRKAIQCAYWAAIARLQSSGVLPSGSARTPREYLQYATASTTRPLRSLTASLERFWYGGAPATPADFSACLDLLEDLGWRLD